MKDILYIGVLDIKFISAADWTLLGIVQGDTTWADYNSYQQTVADDAAQYLIAEMPNEFIEAGSAAPGTPTNFEGPYRTNITYHANDVVIYQGRLWAAKVDIALSGIWDESQWLAVTWGGPPLPRFSNFYVFGHSYLDPHGVGISKNNSTGARLQAIFGVNDGRFFNLAVSGSRVRDHATGCSYVTVLQNVAPGKQAWPRSAIVGGAYLMWTTNDAVFGPPYVLPFIEGYKSAIAALIEGYSLESDDADVSYAGTWATTTYESEVEAGDAISGSGFTYRWSSTVGDTFTWDTPDDFAVGQESGDVYIHFIGSYDGAEVELYVDGVLNQTINTGDRYPNAGWNFKVGVTARIAGLDPGPHTIQGEIISIKHAGKCKLDRIGIGAATPGTIIASNGVQSSNPSWVWWGLEDPTIIAYYNNALWEVKEWFDNPAWFKIADSNHYVGEFPWLDDGTGVAVLKSMDEWMNDPAITKIDAVMIESDTGAMKIGDGVHNYRELVPMTVGQICATFGSDLVAQTDAAWNADHTVYPLNKLLVSTQSCAWRIGDGENEWADLVNVGMDVVGPYIDSWGAGFKHGWERYQNRINFSVDGLHPNSEGAKKLAGAAHEAAIEAYGAGLEPYSGVAANLDEIPATEPSVWTTGVGSPVALVDDFDRAPSTAIGGVGWIEKNGGWGVDASGQAYVSRHKFKYPTVMDDFNRANSAVTLGPNWTALRGTWGIINNKAYRPVSGGAVMDLARRAEPGTTHYVELVHSAHSPDVNLNGLGVAFRIKDSSNFMALCPNNFAGGWKLNKVLGGVVTSVADFNDLPSSNGYGIHVEVGTDNVCHFYSTMSSPANPGKKSATTYTIIDAPLRHADGACVGVGMVCGLTTSAASKVDDFAYGPISTTAALSIANVLSRDFGWDDGTYGMIIGDDGSGHSANYFGLAFRIQDAYNYYWLYASVTFGNWILAKVVNGVGTNLDTIYGPNVPGTKVEVKMLGNTFTFFFNGSQEVEGGVLQTHTDATFPSSHEHGFHAPFNSSVPRINSVSGGQIAIPNPKRGAMHIDTGEVGVLNIYGPYDSIGETWPGPVSVPAPVVDTGSIFTLLPTLWQTQIRLNNNPNTATHFVKVLYGSIPSCGHITYRELTPSGNLCMALCRATTPANGPTERLATTGTFPAPPAGNITSAFTTPAGPTGPNDYLAISADNNTVVFGCNGLPGSLSDALGVGNYYVESNVFPIPANPVPVPAWWAGYFLVGTA